MLTSWACISLSRLTSVRLPASSRQHRQSLNALLCCHIHQFVLLPRRHRRVAHARRLRVSSAALQIRRRAAPQRRAPSAEQDKPARETLLIFPTPGGKVGVHVDSTFLDTDPPSVIGLWVSPPAHTPRQNPNPALFLLHFTTLLCHSLSRHHPPSHYALR